MLMHEMHTEKQAHTRAPSIHPTNLQLHQLCPRGLAQPCIKSACRSRPFCAGQRKVHFLRTHIPSQIIRSTAFMCIACGRPCGALIMQVMAYNSPPIHTTPIRLIPAPAQDYLEACWFCTARPLSAGHRGKHFSCCFLERMGTIQWLAR